MMLLPLADNLESLGLFVGSLLFLLIAMGLYRSPAVALMPDLTPKPLRSQANAIINLMGAVGGVYTLILISLLLKDDGKQDYTPVFLGVAFIMVLAVAVQEPLQVVAGQDTAVYEVSREEKARRLQWLLKQLFKETLQENNEELYRGVKDVLLKELDYQFRMQEEKEEERNAEKMKREEEHYKKIDELLRKKRGRIKK